LAPTTTTVAPTTTTTTDAPTTTTTTISYFYYSSTSCNDASTLAVRSLTPLQIGDVIKSTFGNCFTITAETGTFGFDYTDVYSTCELCEALPTTTVAPTTTLAPTTTTLAPTTTTTTTPSLFIQVSDEDRASAGDACSELIASTPKYYIGTFGNGTVLYDDMARTTVFAASGDYYNISNTHSATINGSGVVSNYTICPGTTTTTTPPTYELLLGRDGGDSESACAASKTTYYGNDTNLNTSTLLYTDVGGTTFATAGYYADDFIWKYWNGTSFTSDGICGETTTTVAPTTTTLPPTTTTLAPTTTTLAPTTTTTLPPSTFYYITSAYVSSACNETTGLIGVYLSGTSTIPALGLIVYSDAALTSTFAGTSGDYIGLDTTTGTPAIYSIIVDGSGEITSFIDCSAATTLPPTTTTTTTPTTYELSLGRDGGDSATACAATKSTYYGNDTNLNTSTLLYTDAGGTTFATAGYYADDFIWKYWDGSAFTSNGSC
jgi:hypothetical protein